MLIMSLTFGLILLQVSKMHKVSFFQSQGKIGLKYSTLDSIHGVNTVLHEIMHGIVYQYGLVEHLGDKEEVTVNTITNGLTTVLVDNPWLIDYIRGQVKK
jgi:hypothetical protein